MRRVTINVGKNQRHYVDFELFNDTFSTGDVQKTWLILVEFARIWI